MFETTTAQTQKSHKAIIARSYNIVTWGQKSSKLEKLKAIMDKAIEAKSYKSLKLKTQIYKFTWS